MVYQGYIKRRMGTTAIVSTRFRGTDTVVENCNLPVNTTVYYTRTQRGGRYYASRIETEPFDLDD